MSRYLVAIGTRRQSVGVLALFSLLLAFPEVTLGAVPLLSAPARANGLFMFTLRGESKVDYVIQPGWSSEDMNVDFPKVKAPFSGGAFAPGPGTGLCFPTNVHKPVA